MDICIGVLIKPRNCPGGLWNYFHLTDREIKAQEGDSTCLRAHSFKQEQALEVGCQIPHVTSLSCTWLVLASWSLGSWREALHFLTLQPPSAAPYLGLSNSVCPHVSCSHLHWEAPGDGLRQEGQVGLVGRPRKVRGQEGGLRQ